MRNAIMLLWTDADSSRSPSWRCCGARFYVLSYHESCSFCSSFSSAMDMENLLRSRSYAISGTCLGLGGLQSDYFWVFPVPSCLPLTYDLILNWLWFLPEACIQSAFQILIACMSFCVLFAKKSWANRVVLSRGSYTVLCNALQGLNFCVWNHDLTWEIIK